jgi:peroxiredoxin
MGLKRAPRAFGSPVLAMEGLIKYPPRQQPEGSARVMTINRRNFAALALGAMAAAAQHRAKAATPRVGRPAPDFQALTLDGRRVGLEDFTGEVVVLNFWATWCGPCKVELPLLDDAYRRLGRAGLRVLAVTTEDSLPLSQLRPLAKALAVPMVRAFQGPYAPLGAVPTNFVIDRQGVLRYGRAGAFTRSDLDQVLGPLLYRPAPRHEAAPDIA